MSSTYVTLNKIQLLIEATGDSLADFDALLARVRGLAEREVRICGPAPMVEALKVRLERRSVPAHAIHYESFDFR